MRVTFKFDVEPIKEDTHDTVNDTKKHSLHLCFGMFFIGCF